MKEVNNILQEESYYPFGLQHSGTKAAQTGTENQYQYNGKEYNTEIGMYDYGARFYMADLGRWGVVDPLAENAYNWTPFRYAFNNPLIYIDPDGQLEVSKETSEKYKLSTLFLNNIDKIYNGQYDQLPTELSNALEGIDMKQVITENLQGAFEEYSTLSDEQIAKALTEGEGPLIIGQDLDKGLDLTNGYTYTSYDGDGNVTNVIISDKTDGYIDIDDDLFNMMEAALGGESSGGFRSGEWMTNEQRTLSVQSFISTAFHELVHYGRFKNIKPNRNPASEKEYGKEFEIRAYGRDVGDRITPP